MKITLMQAYAIEALRSKSVTNSDIIEKAENNKLDDFKNINENLDYSEIQQLHDEGSLQTVLEEGYTIKFLTFNGLRNLLKMKFDKLEDRDYTLDEFHLNDLTLTSEEAAQIKQMMSENWKLVADGDKYHISPSKSE